jgi:hypothetical protein
VSACTACEGPDFGMLDTGVELDIGNAHGHAAST